MPRIKVKKSGKWADPQPHIPQVEFEAGEEYDVSPGLAEVMVDANCADYVKVNDKEPAKRGGGKNPAKRGGGKNPAQADKEAADKGKADA